MSRPANKKRLRARLLLPFSGAPIEDGGVAIENGTITAVGRWKEIAAGEGLALDLGECMLLPGLLNAHCHLDYTEMLGQIAPGKSFPDWIKEMLVLKAHWSYSEYAHSWLQGAKMLLRHGATLVVDVESVPELLPETWGCVPLRVWSFLELTGIQSRREPSQIVHQAVEKLSSLPPGRCRGGLSPHSPYATRPKLLRLAQAVAKAHRWKTAIHLAESQDEFDMYQSRSGRLFEWLQSQRDMNDCGGCTPAEHLDRHGCLSEDLLAIHVNYLGKNDAALLASKGVTVVHCPRSHHYFGHRAFPYQELVRAGVNVCLATDSLATVRKGRGTELDLFAEMRSFAGAHPMVSPSAILEMVTVRPARALGLAGRAGALVEGARADLIAIPFQGTAAEAADAAVHYSKPVRAAMIDGEWAISP